MTVANSNSNNLFEYILKNSLFTPRQFNIISQRLHDTQRRENISSGAYYRQLKQCRDKVTAMLYSMILLQSTGIVQPDALMNLNKLAERISVIFASGNSDISSKEDIINGVMSVIDELIKRMSKL
jgi:hypothetical protein